LVLVIARKTRVAYLMDRIYGQILNLKQKEENVLNGSSGN